MRVTARVFGGAVALMVVLMAMTTVSATHDVTYKGTVAAVNATSIKMVVINEKTKKPETITINHDKETKFLRGDVLVTFAEARIQKNEKITATFNTDDDANFASVVRLDAKKQSRAAR